MATRPGPGDGFEQVLPPRRPDAVPRGARRELGRFWERFPGGGVWLAPGLGAVALLALLLHLWRPPGEPLVDAGGVDTVFLSLRTAMTLCVELGAVCAVALLLPSRFGREA